MTHDERIERMARAVYTAAETDEIEFPFEQDRAYYCGIATAALAAAGIEDMVREAANRGFVSGFDWHTDYKTYSSCSEIDTIVRKVMQG
jgi:hypothetical protein